MNKNLIICMVVLMVSLIITSAVVSSLDLVELNKREVCKLMKGCYSKNEENEIECYPFGYIKNG